MRHELGAARSEVGALRHQVDHRDDRLDRLRAAVSQVEHYQPLYGVEGVVTEPARPSRDRAETIAGAVGPLRGLRVLDIGSSLGYMSFALAAHGARVTGWEMSAANAEVARLVGQINGLPVTFQTVALDETTAAGLVEDRHDVILVLSVLHHVIHFQGLDAARRIVRDLLRSAPVLVLELAAQGEDPSLFWDAAQPADPLAVLDLVRDEVEVTRLGDFPTHLSDSTRPVYRVSRAPVVTVNGHPYPYDTVTGEAYALSPVVLSREVERRYYFGEGVVVKDYVFSSTTPDNWNQILRELYIHNQFADRPAIHHHIALLDWEVDARHARLVLERLPGTLLSDLPPTSPPTLASILHDVLHTLADLADRGFHHNDVRSWNILVDGSRAWLLDYGRCAHDSYEDDVVALAWAAVAARQGGREPAADRKVDLPDLAVLDVSPLDGYVTALRDGERDPRRLMQTLPAPPP